MDPSQGGSAAKDWAEDWRTELMAQGWIEALAGPCWSTDDLDTGF